MSPDILGSRVAAYQPDRYLAFPTMLSLDNGDVLLAFRSGRNCYTDFPEELVAGLHHPHTDCRSEPWLARSADNGVTWEAQPPVRDRRAIEADHQRGIAYQDLGLTKLPDGRVLLTVFRWQYSNDPPPASLTGSVRRTPPTRYQPFSYAYTLPPVYTVADPAGRHWTEFREIDVPHPRLRVRWGLGTRNGGIVLDERTVGCPFYTGQPEDRAVGTDCHLLRYDTVDDRWSYGTPLARGGEGAPMEEPLIHRCADGAILGLYRSSNSGEFRYNYSDDNGASWSPLQNSHIKGHPFAALTLPDRRILLVYGYRHKPYGIRGRVLDPNGRHIEQSREFVIRDDGVSVDIGYPTLCATSGGDILLAYYFFSRDDTIAPTRYIAVTRLANP